jgi:peptidoglycan/xylan/chitin deacetylase (PgdA/CDA1 family)
MKRRIKTLLGFVAFHLGLYRLFFRRKAVIVLFHRVDDRYATDAISCSVEKFDTFCAFFGKFFIVVSLSELLGKLQRGEDISRNLVITFDDGYRDNREIAAPRLKRANLPACFFIATNFIESERVPWWDADAGIPSEWMSWDQVRDLASEGFELGAHTLNHVDLGVVAGEEAAREIADSGARLGAEVGRTIDLFSYPYGRVHQITEANRQEVRRAGYSCCVSAYGGSVVPDSNLYDLRRVPIAQWHESKYQFGFEAMTMT